MKFSTHFIFMIYSQAKTEYTKGYGGLVISSMIKGVLQPKVRSGIRLSWGQILSTDGKTFSGEIDLIASKGPPLRVWNPIGYTIERIEFVKALFEVKHTKPSLGVIKEWGEKVEKFYTTAKGSMGYVQKSIGVIVLWDPSVQKESDFRRNEEELIAQLPASFDGFKHAFILSGGKYEAEQRVHNLNTWDNLANLIETILPLEI
ncbi:MAG: hypothetical protein RTU92_09930 [Candidatus Thorarchaeota archaeon]